MKGSIRERRPKVWNICVELPPGPGGKRRQKNYTTYGAKRDAQRRLREILTELDQGKYTPPGRMTVGQYLAQWLERQTVEASTLRSYETICRVRIVPALGHIVLSKLTGADIEQFHANSPCSPATVRQTQRILSVALNAAVRQGLIPSNPALGAKRPKVVDEGARYLEQDEFTRLLGALKGSQHFPAVLVAATTGMRVGEIAGLMWNDFSAGRLSVRRTVIRTAGGELQIKPAPKTKHGRRTISLPPVTIRALREHRWRQYRTYQPLGFRPEFMFPSPEGGADSPDNIAQAVSRASERCGIDASFHSLRHTHASQLIAEGVSLKVVSERLGHASITITADLYGHLLRGVDEAAANAINNRVINV